MLQINLLTAFHGIMEETEVNTGMVSDVRSGQTAGIRIGQSSEARGERLYGKILSMAAQLGFSAVGCAGAGPLDEDIARYESARKNGCFASMEYLERNMDKRCDPRLLVAGARSVLVFLAPFGSRPVAGLFAGGVDKESNGAVINGSEANSAGGNGADIGDAWSNDTGSEKSVSGGLKVSEFAHGLDYHKVIKERLYLIARLIKDFCDGKATCRVFTDSAPVIERAWAVRAGLGFIGKNNFLISPECGIKNFIGVIITTAELPCFPYGKNAPEVSAAKTAPGEYRSSGISAAPESPDVPVIPITSGASGCGSCTRCIDACRRHALSAPYTLDASKCLSYKTIESRSLDEKIEGGWIFGCDDCMNACPWNSRNKPGWPEFAVNKTLLENTSAEFWNGITADGFEKLFSATPLKRAGLEKIQANVKAAFAAQKRPDSRPTDILSDF